MTKTTFVICALAFPHTIPEETSVQVNYVEKLAEDSTTQDSQENANVCLLHLNTTQAQSLTSSYDIPQTRQKCLTERHYKPLQRRQISYGGNNSCRWRNLLLYFAVTKSTFRDYFEIPSHCVKQLYCWICFLLFHSYQKSFCITLLFELKLLVISGCPTKLIHSQI